MQSTGVKTELAIAVGAVFSIVNAYKPDMFPAEVQAAIIMIITIAAGYFARLRATKAKGVK